MPKFRKKPVVIEAVLFDGKQHGEYANFIPPGKYGYEWYANPAESVLVIDTREGRMRASVGDWIIKGVKGEFYPCKPDIFAATYEPVEQQWSDTLNDELRRTEQV